MAENDGGRPRDLKKIITEIDTRYADTRWFGQEGFADFEQGRWLGTDLERVFLAKPLFFSVPTDTLREPRDAIAALRSRPIVGPVILSRCYTAKDLIKFLGIIWYADLDSRLKQFTVCRVFFLLAPLCPRTRTRL